jgi:hypothetical protein
MSWVITAFTSSCQKGGFTPNASDNLLQFKREFLGRMAGVKYSLLLIAQAVLVLKSYLALMQFAQ